MLPIQLIDSFLLEYNVGQALLLVFILATLGALPLKSAKVVALNTMAFGVIFLLTPQSLVPLHYLFLGIALVIIGPLLWTTSRD
ncbi:hypothetical protein C474_05025 [Halogeometricum pallidum JCM 14848]|uniref:DUF8006 domain-containing protein n=1 Tax=Halogeometricum pallidum JCM 14848 TaxID=1227487 RepID=M0DD68_HALPD|nr:hypothetical protein [Halogeometricum pallidum]ELZ33415.1 hypothetical protein C474_05025 [Halogeometricum pallidum JCM 14848]